MTPRDDFYIGYRREAPDGLARFVRRLVSGLILGAVGLAAALALLQSRFEPGVFDFGNPQTFEGRIRERPVPALVEVGPDESARRYFLVGTGKHGAAAQVTGLDGRRVKLEGSLIEREGAAMIELRTGSLETLPSEVEPAGVLTLGAVTLRGEIVDSKCFLGVMKPGRGKPHRACAARCISGGVPPILRVESESGAFRNYLLVDGEGEPVNERVLDKVAEPVEIVGELRSRDSLLYLVADPATYRRLGEE